MAGGGRLRRHLRGQAARLAERGLVSGVEGAPRGRLPRRRRYTEAHDSRDGQARRLAAYARREADLLPVDGVAVADRVRLAYAGFVKRESVALRRNRR